MSITMGQQVPKHNYFSFEDFYSFNRRAGTIQTHNAQRVAKVSEDFIIGLQTGLEEQVGDAAPVILYKCGYEWGLADVKNFEATMYKEYGRDVQEMNVAFMMEEWWWPLQAMGWGSWEIDLVSKRDQGLILINLYDSVVAKTLGEVGKPVCFIYAGMFAGALTALSRKALAGIEIQCYAVGASYCRFIVGSEKRLNPVEFWLEEGASASDVLGRL